MPSGGYSEAMSNGSCNGIEGGISGVYSEGISDGPINGLELGISGIGFGVFLGCVGDIGTGVGVFLGFAGGMPKEFMWVTELVA